MNKEQAAAFLGVSLRTLERYTQQGKLGVTYERGSTGQMATYDPEELARFRATLSTSVTKSATVPPTAAPTASDNALAPLANPGEALASLVAILDGLGYRRERERPAAALGEKMLLTLGEAQALTGLSRDHLKRAIAEGELRAGKLGRAWRIKRSHLVSFVDGL
nr:helix-turn-helix domain-containing protein [Gloeobacter morelensis]